MAAGINDKFKKVSADNSYAVATTVKTDRTVGGGTTLEAFDLSKWADQTAVNFLTYRKTTDPVTNITTVTNRAGWTGLVNTSSNTLTNLTIAPGYTDLGQQVGDYIEPVQMSKWANDLVDGILVSHNQDGTLKNKVAALTKINGGATAGLLKTDASGNVTVGKATADNVDYGSLLASTQYDSGWINVTFQNGYSNQNSTTVSYRKVGNVVFLRGQPGKATLDTNIIFTLPVSFRPNTNGGEAVFICPSSSTNTGKLSIRDDGTVKLAGIPSATYVAIDAVCFPSA